MEEILQTKKENFAGYFNSLSEPEKSLIMDVLKFAIQKGSVSFAEIRKHFEVGYGRAVWVMENLIKFGFIPDYNETKQCKALITENEFKAMFGNDVKK